MAQDTMPWQVESSGKNPDEHFKYQYHPGGDTSKAPKHAPSALNVVIIPAVTLPKVRIARAAEKNDADPRNRVHMTDLISGARTDTRFLWKLLDTEPANSKSIRCKTGLEAPASLEARRRSATSLLLH